MDIPVDYENVDMDKIENIVEESGLQESREGLHDSLKDMREAMRRALAEFDEDNMTEDEILHLSVKTQALVLRDYLHAMVPPELLEIVINDALTEVGKVESDYVEKSGGGIISLETMVGEFESL